MMKPFFSALLIVLFSSSAMASTSHVELTDVEVDMSPASLKAGAKIMMETCVQCHSMKYVKFRHLAEVGFSPKEINDLRGEKDINASLERAMDMEAVRAMFGLVPPDLSLITQARRGGARYIYSLLAGFYTTEEGKVDNHVFPGIRMPDIFNVSQAQDEQERQAILANIANISAFLAWASDPNSAKREDLGYYVLGYIALLALMYYLVKRRIWQGVKNRRQTAEEAPTSKSRESLTV